MRSPEEINAKRAAKAAQIDAASALKAALAPLQLETPMFTVDELRGTGVAMVMYPLSLFHAMNAVALKVLLTIRKDGTQRDMLDAMQTRDELYDYLDYHAYEARLDQLLAKDPRD